MAKSSRPNYEGIVSYLRSIGIDANRVKEEGYDETGYNEIVTYDNGRPVYTGKFQIATIRREWPTPEAFRTVEWLRAGGSLEDLPKEETPKKESEPALPPTPEEKQKEPAASKPVARKKETK